jgi:hypothetical protein
MNWRGGVTRPLERQMLPPHIKSLGEVRAFRANQ